MYKYLIIAPTIPSPIFTPKQINKYCYKSATMKLTTFSIFFMLVASIAALPGNDASGLVLRQTDEECQKCFDNCQTDSNPIECEELDCSEVR
jgi:hypothetical protein